MGNKCWRKVTTWSPQPSRRPRRHGRVKATVRLECGHSRDFLGDPHPKLVNCPFCQYVRQRYRLLAGRGYNPELIRLLQGEWLADAQTDYNIAIDRLLVICDWLEDHGDPRVPELRALIATRPNTSALGKVNRILPELEYAWCSDPTLWPFQDMKE